MTGSVKKDEKDLFEDMSSESISQQSNSVSLGELWQDIKSNRSSFEFQGSNFNKDER